MSVAAKLGLPEAFQTTLLVIAVVLTLVPYFSGTTVGSLQIPKLDPRKRRRLRIGGPLLLLASIAVVLPLPILGRRPIDLHVIAADVTEAGDIDIAIQNAGANAVLLTAVELEVIDDRGLIGRPVLPTGAAYRVPIDDLAIGERRRVPIRFLVPAGAIERIVITPMTGRALVVRLRVVVDNKVELTSMIKLGPPQRALWLFILLVFGSSPAYAATMKELHEIAELVHHEQNQEARERLKAIPRGDPREEAFVEMLLGSIEAIEKNPFGTVFRLGRAADRFEAAGDVVGAALVLSSVGWIENTMTRNAQGLAALERAYRLLRTGEPGALRFDGLPLFLPLLGPISSTAEAVDLRIDESYIHVLIAGGNLAKAEQELQRIMPVAVREGGSHEGGLQAEYGDLRRLQIRFDEARQNYLTALKFDLEGHETAVAGKLAELELLMGNPRSALEWNAKSLAMARATKEPRRIVAALLQRAAFLNEQQRTAEAERTFEEALQVVTLHEDHLWHADVLLNMALGDIQRGRYEKATVRIHQAIGLVQELGRPDVESFLWLFSGMLHLLTSTNDRADEAFAKARAAADRGGITLVGEILRSISSEDRMPKLPSVDAQTIAWIIDGFGGDVVGSISAFAMQLRVSFLLRRGHYSEVRALVDTGKLAAPNPDLHAVNLALIAESYRREGRGSEALDAYRRAVAAIEEVADTFKVEELLASYLGSHRIAYYDTLIDMLVGEGLDAEAFAVSEKARSRAFLRMIGNRRVNPLRSDSAKARQAELLRKRIDAWERLPANAGDPARGRVLQNLRTEYVRTLTDSKLASTEYGSMMAVRSLDVESVQRDLPPDVTLISYFVTQNFVHAWVIDQDEFHHAVLPWTPGTIERLTCWTQRSRVAAAGYRGMEPTSPSGCEDEVATQEEGFRALFGPIQRFIRHDRLLVIPHGVLHYVPFAALRNPNTHCHLVEDFTLQQLPSASVIPFLRQKETSMEHSALILGNPKGDLPGAEAEAVTIARMFGTKAMVRGRARAARLRSLRGKVDLVHVGAHGIYDSANPMFSRIELADGDLEVHEILSSLDLRGVNLLVLSACSTAAGVRSAGDEVVGLTLALLYAGSPGVVSTLWDIEDSASAELMTAFYRKWRSGATAGEALRDAQRSLLNRMPYADPSYWAGFVLTGDPQKSWGSLTSSE